MSHRDELLKLCEEPFVPSGPYRIKKFRFNWDGLRTAFIEMTTTADALSEAVARMAAVHTAELLEEPLLYEEFEDEFDY